MTKYRYEQNRVYLGSDDVIAMCSNEAMAKALTQAANAMCKVDGQIKDCDSVAPTYLYDSLRAVRHLKIKCDVLTSNQP